MKEKNFPAVLIVVTQEGVKNTRIWSTNSQEQNEGLELFRSISKMIEKIDETVSKKCKKKILKNLKGASKIS